MNASTHLPVFANGRLNFALVPKESRPGVSVLGACAAVEWADGVSSSSPAWRLETLAPLVGEDRCGPFEGQQAGFICGDRLRIQWSAVAYRDQPVLAVWMQVTNVARVDQHLLRLSALRAHAGDGARVEAPFDAERALILNNGMWMDLGPLDWRSPIPDLRDAPPGDPRTSPEASPFWSIGAGEPHSPALVMGIGEAATSFAGIELTRAGHDLNLDMGGWLWVDLARRPLRLRPGQTFALQRMLILTAGDLHHGLTAYADFVARFAGCTLHHPPYAGIFSAYGGDPAGEHPERHPLTQQRIETLREVVDTYLKPYGLDTFKTQFAGLSSGPPGLTMSRSEWTALDVAPAAEGLVDRVYESAFTPDVYDSRQDFPAGIEAHVRDLKARGYRPALVCRPFLNVRSGPPEYDCLAADLFGMAVERWGYEYLMFDFNSADYETADDTHTMAQGIRSRFQAVRDRVGPDVFIEACMVAPGPVLGIADGFRHANDWRGGTEVSLAQQACTRYHLHQRWFQLDHEFFDPQLRPFTWGQQGVEGVSASLDRVRLWTSFGALTGFSWLTGGVIESVSPERWAIFTRALPVYGPCARPMDLLDNDPPRLWLLEAEGAGMRYQVAGVFNWHERPLSMRLNASDLGGNAAAGWLWFDFWEQRLHGPADSIQCELPPCSCKVFMVHPAPASTAPVWVGTDRHVTGAIGLTDLNYDAQTLTLAGRCVGPAATMQNHYFYLPQDLAPVASEGVAYEAPQYRLLKVVAQMDERGVCAWRLKLQVGRGIR